MSEQDSKKSERVLAALKVLAEELGVELGDTGIAIATERKEAKVMAHDGYIQATIPPERGVMVESKKGPGIRIRLVEDIPCGLLPEGAIYHIETYVPDGKGWIKDTLNGDVFSVYVGKNGIILDNPARERAAKLYKEDEKKRYLK